MKDNARTILGYILVFFGGLLICGVFGYFLYPQINPPVEKTLPPDTTHTKIEYRNPKPGVVQAVVDSIVADSLGSLIARLPAYHDTITDTLHHTVYHFAKTKKPYIVGYYNQSDQFVKQGRLTAWYIFERNEFIFDYFALQPTYDKIVLTKYIIQKEPKTLMDNRYVNLGLGIGVGIGVYWGVDQSKKAYHWIKQRLTP